MEAQRDLAVAAMRQRVSDDWSIYCVGALGHHHWRGQLQGYLTRGCQETHTERAKTKKHCLEILQYLFLHCDVTQMCDTLCT